MTDDRTQVSAFIARETKASLEAHVAATGRKKGAVIEDALQSFLANGVDLPAEYVVPAEIVLSAESFERVTEMIERPAAPTGALRVLMAGRVSDQQP